MSDQPNHTTTDAIARKIANLLEQQQSDQVRQTKTL